MMNMWSHREAFIGTKWDDKFLKPDEKIKQPIYRAGSIALGFNFIASLILIICSGMKWINLYPFLTWSILLLMTFILFISLKKLLKPRDKMPYAKLLNSWADYMTLWFHFMISVVFIFCGAMGRIDFPPLVIWSAALMVTFTISAIIRSRYSYKLFR